MSNSYKSSVTSELDKPPVRYWGKKDQLGAKMLGILDHKSTPTGTCLFGTAYDRLTDVAEVAGTSESACLLNGADSLSGTQAIARYQLRAGPAPKFDLRFYAEDPLVRLVSRIESLATKKVVIENAEGLPNYEFVLLSHSLATIDPKKRPKFLLTVTGRSEAYDAVLNNGKLPWGIQECRPLNPRDMIGFLQKEGVKVAKGLLADGDGMLLLATVTRQAPQGLKRLADILKGENVTVLKFKELKKLAPLLDSRVGLPKQIGHLVNLSGIRIPSSRTRGRAKIPRGDLGQLPLF